MDNKTQQHVPLSWNKAKQAYLEKAFWLGLFKPGSSFTIVEDLPRGKSMRYYIKPNPKGGKPFDTNLIKISDGFVEKDLELGDTDASLLFATVPDTLMNLKGSTFVNESGRWRYIAQSTPEMNENFPKSQEIAASMEPTPASTDIGNQIRALHAAMQANQAVRIFNSVKVTTDIAEKTRPGDAKNLIEAARREGWIRDITEAGVSGYRAE